MIRSLPLALASLARPLLLRLEPERAHDLTIKMVRLLPPSLPARDDKRLAIDAFGLSFKNPLGLAAGFDKNARVPRQMARLGFGFVEIGTVTPRPQTGNPRPRLFRLAADQAAINRFGFNNEGHEHVHGRLARRRLKSVPLGVNLGANKESEDRAADYVAGIAAFADVASYFTINVSSPNTPGLRDLQAGEALDDLLARVLAARDEAAGAHGRKPVLLKIAPDLTLSELDTIVAVARRRGIDGMIVSNTTISRPPALRDKAQSETGGLSGKPLFLLSTRMLAATYQRVEGQFPLIGAGGIDSPETALAKIEAGASLLQLYTALVFHGPALVQTIKRGLLPLLKQKNYPRLADAIGKGAADWGPGKASRTNVR